MPRLKNLLNPRAYERSIWSWLHARQCRFQPNLRGTLRCPPGHYYSPLLNIASLGRDDLGLPFDGYECWEHIRLRRDEQRSYYEDLLENFPFLPFPADKTEGYRYFTKNNWFHLFDAFTLSGVIRKEKPKRIVEIGSGFSSAVILDTLERTQHSAQLTCIEPFPVRLKSLIFRLMINLARFWNNRFKKCRYQYSISSELEIYYSSTLHTSPKLAAMLRSSCCECCPD